MIDEKAFKEEVVKLAGSWPKRGVALLEAPRGIFIHDEVKYITSTAVNISALGPEAELFVKKAKHLKKAKKKAFVEDLVRASDPCITCAVH